MYRGKVPVFLVTRNDPQTIETKYHCSISKKRHVRKRRHNNEEGEKRDLKNWISRQKGECRWGRGGRPLGERNRKW